MVAKLPAGQIDELSLTPKSQFIDKYSFIVGETSPDLVSLVLKLEDQELVESDAPQADFTIDDVDFLEM